MVKPTEHYDPSEFAKLSKRAADFLMDYLRACTEDRGLPVLPHTSPDEMLHRWSAEVPREGIGSDAAVELLKDIIDQSHHIHVPRYIGHQVCAPLPLAAVCDQVGSLLNNANAVYEMGPVDTILQTHIINWIAGLAGYPEGAGGVMTNGGSLGNLTALLAARQAKVPGNVWRNGYADGKPCPAILVSEQAHYSIKRAAQIMGLGAGGAVMVASDENYCMDVDDLEHAHREADNAGRRVFAVAASCCTTPTGSYDPLEPIADYCERHGLWLHVDGAHGFAAALSAKHRGLLAGIERADSFVWDLHKMMLMPTLITAVLFRRRTDSFAAFSQQASYLLEQDSEERWFDIAARTVECTKVMHGLRAYVPLQAYGSDFFVRYVERCVSLTERFAGMLEEAPDFTLATRPQFNIICFRYEPQGYPKDKIERLQRDVREEIVRTGRFYITRTELRGRQHLRCTVINPLTTEDDIAALIEEIRVTGRELVG